MIHPGPADGGDNDAILRFVAPKASTYTFSGTFSRIDGSNGAGTGVIGAIFANDQQKFSGYVAPTTGASVTSGTYSVQLQAGQSIDFAVRSNGNYFNDSTGLVASISTVPEPATWAMMILGFGVVGGVMRRRASVARTAFA